MVVAAGAACVHLHPTDVRATPTSARPPRFHFSESSGWTVCTCPKRRTGRNS
jgi:hypothetical protein